MLKPLCIILLCHLIGHKAIIAQLPYVEIEEILTFRESLYNSNSIFREESCSLLEYDINSNSSKELIPEIGEFTSCGYQNNHYDLDTIIYFDSVDGRFNNDPSQSGNGILKAYNFNTDSVTDILIDNSYDYSNVIGQGKYILYVKALRNENTQEVLSEYKWYVYNTEAESESEFEYDGTPLFIRDGLVFYRRSNVLRLANLNNGSQRSLGRFVQLKSNLNFTNKYVVWSDEDEFFVFSFDNESIKRISIPDAHLLSTEHDNRHYVWEDSLAYIISYNTPDLDFTESTLYSYDIVHDTLITLIEEEDLEIDYNTIGNGRFVAYTVRDQAIDSFGRRLRKLYLKDMISDTSYFLMEGFLYLRRFGLGGKFAITEDYLFAQGDFLEPIRRYDLKMIGDLVSSVDIDVDKEEYVLYPNPVTDHVSLRSDNKAVSVVAVYDIHGRVVMTSTSMESLDVSQLIPGTYIFKLQVDDTVVTQKIIKIY